MKLSEVPTISVLVHDDRIYSLDNRRLWVFNHCGLSEDSKIPVIIAKKDRAFWTKLTTPSEGQTMRRRS